MPLKDKEAQKKYNREYQRLYYTKMKQNKEITPNHDDEQMILFYYKMINTKKDFAIWIRNMRRVNQQFIYIRDSNTQTDSRF